MLCCFRAADNTASVKESSKQVTAPEPGAKSSSKEDEAEKSQNPEKGAEEKGVAAVFKSTFLLSTGPRQNPNTAWLKVSITPPPPPPPPPKQW